MNKIWYWTLFGMESAGMAYIFYRVLPFYRGLLRGPGGDRPGAHLIVPGLCVLLIMQVCYWSKRKVRIPLARRQNAFVAHVLLFLSRLSFIFAGAVLSLAIFTRSADTRFSPIGIAILVAATFAQFCYARELEALSRKFEEPG